MWGWICHIITCIVFKLSGFHNTPRHFSRTDRADGISSGEPSLSSLYYIRRKNSFYSAFLKNERQTPLNIVHAGDNYWSVKMKNFRFYEKKHRIEIKTIQSNRPIQANFSKTFRLSVFFSLRPRISKGSRSEEHKFFLTRINGIHLEIANTLELKMLCGRGIMKARLKFGIDYYF